ncbi:autotransporter [Streptomyces camelliae]|uniref:Autotransporter n=1 Tax=Streptomyces camelliae TaxID=3004093 RepID=A0ABY7P5I6_9ACTN|nr:autotransporter [Streptomyces sp. HUAS 2-6]WBO64952.1 autotransporter [Streptomyces sp. HUAS 2-6]
MKRSWHLVLASVLVAGAVTPVVAVGSAVAADGDITSAVLANRDVVLTGDAVVRVPQGTHTYTGVISGEGTLRVSGTGTLVLAKDSTFTLPHSRQHQRVQIPGGNHPYVVVGSPDEPAVTVDAGATLQYGTGGTTGLIGSFPYNTPGYQQNQDNIQVNGTLRLSLTRLFNLGVISGSGLVTQPRNMWGTLQICGTNPFSGIFDNGTGVNFASTTCAADLPNARSVVNRGSWIIDTPLNHTVVQRQNFYSHEYGNDVNVHSRPGSKVILTGVYSWSDSGDGAAPSLSDPGLNWRPVAHKLNKRGTNIEGADVQWGDGTTHRIFMPGTAQTVYINLHARRQRSRLTFDYNGPVTLGAPIGGGMYHDTLGAPGAGDVVIAGTSGNDVTFAAAQYYDGSTTIARNATLRLGSGTAGGDGSLHTGGALDKVIDNGSLVLRNTRTPTTLPTVTGAGSVTQSGAAATTVTSAAYTGATTVAKGSLIVSGTSLRTSSAVALTGSSAVLDLSKARDTALRRLQVVTGAKILLSRNSPELTVGSTTATVSGSGLAIGGARFSVSRAGADTVLTALTSTTAAHPSSAATGPAPSPARTGRAATPLGASTGTMADTGSNVGALWTVTGLAGVVLAGVAAVFVFVRGRSRLRTSPRHRR